jgi:hypothetical protein
MNFVKNYRNGLHFVQWGLAQQGQEKSEMGWAKASWHIVCDDVNGVNFSHIIIKLGVVSRCKNFVPTRAGSLRQIAQIKVVYHCAVCFLPEQPKLYML